MTADKQESLSKEEVQHIAQLANLELTEEEIKLLKQQLSETVEYISILEKLETDGVEETSQVTGITNRLRKDEIKPGLTQEEALASALKTHNGYFVVPYVFGNEESTL